MAFTQRAAPSFCLGLALVFTSCYSTHAPVDPRPALEPAPAVEPGEQIVICGQRFSIGAPVVLWTDPGGYNGYSTERHFKNKPKPKRSPAPGTLRYQPGRVSRDALETQLVEPHSRSVEELGEVVDQFVLHYDVCGASQSCFKILHDHRGLSVHFLLDVDGTLYQTMDLREQCWHATKANTRSIGVEIAHIGGRPKRSLEEMESWYVRDAKGLRIQYPSWLGDGGVRTQDFVGRPRRNYRVEGVLQGEQRYMYDYTPEQFETLVRLSATLCEVFPNMHPDAPRDRSGQVARGVLSDAQFDSFGGILGHFHVQRNKVDPGVAFDWEPFLAQVRQRMR
ncbi:MAG: N-acetylmuramoyl-L-alanine amidase [Planctomycetes bacterium]|nr:N-acetylmuramoyl-L-alanine amidase [Planctomycetota bacterium]